MQSSLTESEGNCIKLIGQTYMHVPGLQIKSSINVTYTSILFRLSNLQATRINFPGLYCFRMSGMQGLRVSLSVALQAGSEARQRGEKAHV